MAVAVGVCVRDWFSGRRFHASLEVMSSLSYNILSQRNTPIDNPCSFTPSILTTTYLRFAPYLSSTHGLVDD